LTISTARAEPDPMKSAAVLIPKVEGEALDPQRLLHLDGHGRIGALHVRSCADYCADLADVLAPALDRLLGRLDRDLGQHRDLVVRPLGNDRAHQVGVDQAGLVDHEAGLDARGLLDELGRRRGQGRDFAGGDRLRVGGVEPLDIGVEGLDQLGVREAVRRGVKARGRDHGLMQNAVSDDRSSRCTGSFGSQ
jgi:hypothetical protein